MIPEQWIVTTFAGGSIWKPAVKRLRRQVIQNKHLSYLSAKDEKWFFNSPLVPEETKNFVKNNKQGFGLWVWKPYLLKTAFREFPSCKGIVYLDAGCEINNQELASVKLKEYLNYATKNKAFTFQIMDSDYVWTTTEVINRLDGDSHAKSGQIIATAFILANNPENREFIDLWVENCENNQFANLIGESKSADRREFKQHRHDQSIFSLLFKKRQIQSVPDETFFSEDWRRNGRDFPIWAARNRTNLTLNSSKVNILMYRFLRKLLLTASRNRLCI